MLKWQSLVTKIKPELNENSKLTHPHDGHITLCFIGAVSPTKIASIRNALKTYISSYSANNLKLSFENIEPFPKPNSKILAATATTALEELVSGIADCLTPLGVRRDLRTFRPHVTLLRRINSNLTTFGIHKITPITYNCTQICLYETTPLTPNGRYQILEKFPLTENNK